MAMLVRADPLSLVQYFLQAEDGIRDGHVTGVQTCALPIYIRAEVNTPMSKKVNMMVKTHSDRATAELHANRHYLERFCNVGELTISESVQIPEQAMTAVITGAEIILPLEGLIDFEKEIARLEKEREKWEKEVNLVQKKLSNKGFVEKAPENIVAEERKKEVEYKENLATVEQRLKELNKA